MSNALRGAILRSTPRRALVALVASVTSLAASPAAIAAVQPAFSYVARDLGIDYLQNASPRDLSAGDYDIETGGVAAHDYDGDGWTDLVVSRFDNTPILYRNVSNGRGGRKFVDVTAGSGLQINDKINGLAWGDVDRDGRPDLYATAKSNRHYLFMNKGNGKFVEQAAFRGADLAVPAGAPVHGGMSVAFGDYDRDGYNDIAVGNWLLGDGTNPNGYFQVLHNRGAAAPGHFEVTTYSAGFNVSTNSRRLAFTPRFTDLDNDGWVDMALCSDAGNAKLFWNNHDGTFTDGTAAAHTGTEIAAMGNAVADFDRDGDLDWFVASTYDNRLYRNRTTRTGAAGEPRVFVDATDLGPTGVRHGGWGWGSSFIDYDLDGWQDLVSTNGMYSVDQTMLWRNTGGSGTLGFQDAGNANGVNDSLMGKGLAIFDYDNDGAPDLFIVNNRDVPIVYHNNKTTSNAFVKLELFGNVNSPTGSNPDAFGAKVILSDPLLGPDMLQEVSGGSNYLGQNDPALIFGLGTFSGTIDKVTILWPSGLTQVFHDVDPNQTYLAYEGANKLYSTVLTPEPATLGSLLLMGLLLRRPTRRRSQPADG